MRLRTLRALLTLAILLTSPAVGDAAFLRHFAGGGAGGGGGGGTALALTRVFNNPTGSPTGATAFWMIGQPFYNTFSDPGNQHSTVDELPSGNIVTCKLGGQAGDSQGSATSVPCSLVGRKIAADNSVEWGQLLVDLSGYNGGTGIPAGGKDTLVLTATAGTFCDYEGNSTCLSGFTDAKWTALADVTTLSSVTAASGSTASAVAGSGTWNAKFDGGPTNTVTKLTDGPQGLQVRVTAALWDATSISATATGTSTLTVTATQTLSAHDSVVLNGSGGQLGLCTAATSVSGSSFQCTNVSSVSAGSVTSISPINRNIRVVMYYWATCKASGNTCTTAGPVRSEGPFVENVLIYPKASAPYYANSTLTAYTYNLKFTRNGTDLRGGSAAGGTAYNGLTVPAFGIGSMTRTDAQADWTNCSGTPGGSACDPGIYVTHDYGKVVDTRKVPPFIKNLSYTGSVPGQNNFLFYNTGVTGSSSTKLTVTARWALMNTTLSVNYPQPVEFSGTLGSSSPSIVAGQIYWSVWNSSSSSDFCFYDTLADALLSSSCASATGQVAFSGTWTGATIQIVSAPGATGQFDLLLSQTASRPDLSLVSEWGAAGIVGGATNNTHGAAAIQGWQRLSRVMAYDWSTFNASAIDGNAADAGYGTIISMTQPSETPAGMSSYLSTYYYPDGTNSNDINGGNVTIPGGNGGWNWGGSSRQHTYNSAYGPWIMEGSPFLRDLLVYLGQIGISGNTFHSLTINGTSYYTPTVCNWDGESIRRGAWNLRNLDEAAMAAYQGSPEEAYYRTVLNDNMSECAAYAAAKSGTTYNSLGLIWMSEGNQQTLGTGTLEQGGQIVTTYMETFLASALSWGALLELDYVPGLLTQATFMSKWLNYVYGTGSSACPYFGTAYTIGDGLQEYNDPWPGAYISSLSDLGVITTLTNYVSFISGSPKVPGTTYANGGTFPPVAEVVTTNSKFRTWLGTPPTGLVAAPSPIPGDNVDRAIASITSGATGRSTAGQPVADNPISTTNGSPTVTVNWPTCCGVSSPALTTSAMVNISGATAVGGITLSGYYQITGTTDANHFTINAGTNANATATGGGLHTAITVNYSFGLFNMTANASGSTADVGAQIWFIPSQSDTCPAGSMSVGNLYGETYLTNQGTAAAIMAALNISGALTTYNTMAANADWSPSAAFASEIGWGMAPP